MVSERSGAFVTLCLNVPLVCLTCHNIVGQVVIIDEGAVVKVKKICENGKMVFYIILTLDEDK